MEKAPLMVIWRLCNGNDAYVSLYEATFNETWLSAAKQLADYAFDHFFDADRSMFYFTSNQDADLIARKMEIEDNVIPASKLNYGQKFV